MAHVPVLLDLNDDPALRERAALCATGSTSSLAVSFRSPADALLIRPDGYVHGGPVEA